MKITLCIPMYNEAEIVHGTATAMVEAMEQYGQRSGHTYEIIFSDDGSRDGCGSLIEELSQTLSTPRGHIRLVGTPANHGKGAALRRAVAASDGDLVLYTDCDLAYGTGPISVFCTALEEGAGEIVIGSRKLHQEGYSGYTLLRRIASRAYIKVLSACAGFTLSDSQCGFKAFRGDVARELFAYSKIDGWAFDFEILMRAERAGYRILEMPVQIVNHRKSKVHVARDSIKMLRDIYEVRKNL